MLHWLSFAERLDDLIRDAESEEEWHATLRMDAQVLRPLGYRQLGSDALMSFRRRRFEGAVRTAATAGR
ncbi:hypothetical protein [Streptomyces sp. NPDC001315]|uniref:hypothetical protein n=1 Tax=Streptomyces sp. NPDC001315 TaxID=3364562 RepID=UPI0036BB98F1